MHQNISLVKLTFCCKISLLFYEGSFTYLSFFLSLCFYLTSTLTTDNKPTPGTTHATLDNNDKI